MGKDYYAFKRKGRGIWFVEYEKLLEIKNTDMDDFDIEMLNGMFILRTDEEELFLKTILKKNLYFPQEDCFPFERKENLNVLKECEDELANPDFFHFLRYLQTIRVLYVKDIEKHDIEFNIQFINSLKENFDNV